MVPIDSEIAERRAAVGAEPTAGEQKPPTPVGFERVVVGVTIRNDAFAPVAPARVPTGATSIFGLWVSQLDKSATLLTVYRTGYNRAGTRPAGADRRRPNNKYRADIRTVNGGVPTEPATQNDLAQQTGHDPSH